MTGKCSCLCLVSKIQSAIFLLVCLWPALGRSGRCPTSLRPATGEDSGECSGPCLSGTGRYIAQAFIVRETDTQIWNRAKPSTKYEPALSGREAWWRCYLSEAPGPGTYETQDFLDELAKKIATYLSKTQGRRRHLVFRDGQWLLPGAYGYEDATKFLEKSINTYSFRNTDRKARDGMNFGIRDKDIDLGPGTYCSEKYDSIVVPKMAVALYGMKSQTDRFKTRIKRQGPDVVAYDSKTQLADHPSYSSCFSSKTPRFRSSNTKVPGPGTYAHSFEPIHSWNSSFSDYYV